MTRVIGRGRYAGAVYPEHPGGGGGGLNFVFNQNSDSYSQISGDPTISIAQATITVAEGSRVRIEGMTSLVGSVAAGFALMLPGDVDNVPLLASTSAIESFGAAVGTNLRTLNLTFISDVLPAGDFTIHLILDVNGNAGSRVDGAGITLLALTEIPA